MKIQDYRLLICKKLEDKDVYVEELSFEEHERFDKVIDTAFALHNVVNTLLCDDNIKKMACEYTGSESECQSFILACQVIAEKMQL